MNVRFAADSIRCRLTAEEFELLKSGRAVDLIVALPRNHAFKINVRPGALNQWQLASDPTGIWITVPVSELKSFAETLPSKEGIQRKFELDVGSIDVLLEVDVRKQRRENLAAENA